MSNCKNKVSMWCPPRVNIETLKREDGRYVSVRCGRTGYDGDILLCEECRKSYRFTPEWEMDNPSYEEDY
jgi:hypothetical protein